MKTALLISISLLLSINLLLAQQSDNDRVADRLRQNITNLKIKIEKVKYLAERYSNEKAAAVIIEAEGDFNEANDLVRGWFNGDRGNGNLERAKSKYQSANKKTDYASRLIMEIPVENLSSELELLIQKAETAYHQNPLQESGYYLNKARQYGNKARNAFRNDQFLRGHEFLKMGIYFAGKVIELAGLDEPENSGKDRFQNQINNVLTLISRTQSFINDDPILIDLKNSAQEYYDKALTEGNQGNLKKAFANLQISERFLSRFFDLAENKENGSENDLRSEYQSLGIYLNSVQQEIENSEKKNGTFQKAEELYFEAGKDLDKGNLKQASLNMRLSQRLTIKAFKTMSGSQLDNGDFENRIKEVERLIQLQGQKIKDSDNRSSLSLYNLSVKYFNQAQQATLREHNEQGYYLLNLCMRILNRNEKLITDSNYDTNDYESLLEEINNTEQLIIRLENNPDLDINQLNRVRILKEFLSLAREEIETNNFSAAQQLLIIVKTQFRNSLKL